MHIASIVIANDLLGTVVEIKNNTIVMLDKNSVERELRKSSCVEVTNPYAYAALVYRGIEKRVKAEDNVT